MIIEIPVWLLWVCGIAGGIIALVVIAVILMLAWIGYGILGGPWS